MLKTSKEDEYRIELDLKAEKVFIHLKADGAFDPKAVIRASIIY